MESNRFDVLTRRCTTSVPRRVLLGLAAVTGLSLAATDARKKKKTKKITICLAGETRKIAKKSRSRYLSQGATLGACLSCPQGARACRGACVSTLICCTDGDCAGGRTCQNGTCACPSNKPAVCPGSTICQECCTVTDCRATAKADGLACQNNQCVCTIADTRRCTTGAYAGSCGRCCGPEECPDASICVSATGGPFSCTCFTGSYCLDNDVEYCVPPGCQSTCLTTCNRPGTAAVGQPCCAGEGALVCQEITQGDFRCAPV